MLLFGTPNSGVEKTPVLYRFADDSAELTPHLKAIDKVMRLTIMKKKLTWGSYMKECKTYDKGKKKNSFIADLNNEKG